VTPGPAGAPSRLVLASRSPRRQEALRALGVDYETVVSDAEAHLGPLPDPIDPVPVAVAKALDVAARRPGRLVLAGDTIVALGDQALGKPADEAAAGEMLRRLRGRGHTVRSALALRDETGLSTAEVASPVWMRPYGEAEISRYVASREPLDCAGAYDVHHLGGALVEEVDGCFSAVVGLPLAGAAALLEAAGVQVPHDPVETCSRLYGRPCLAGRPETALHCQAQRLTRRPAKA